MNKEIYLIRGKDNESYSDFKIRIDNIVSSLNTTLEPEAIKFTITVKAPPRISIIPFSKKKIAVISLYNPHKLIPEFIQQVDGFRGCYRVTEALPVAYHVKWQPREATPGTCLLTLFRKKKNIDYPTFIHRWYNVHTPHSLIIHPLWNYARNEVNEKLYPDSSVFDGIVEEQVRVESDLLNPFRFWGNPIVIIPRMIKELFDTKSFIDYKSMETYQATEYLVKIPFR
jgi:hypothetical protein